MWSELIIILANHFELPDTTLALIQSKQNQSGKSPEVMVNSSQTFIEQITVIDYNLNILAPQITQYDPCIYHCRKICHALAHYLRLVNKKMMFRSILVG